MKCTELKNLVNEGKCDWTQTLSECGECVDQSSIFKYFNMVGVILNGLCVLLSMILLKWKVNYLKIWLLIFCVARLFCCLIMLLNLFDDARLIRELIFMISWWPGIVTVFVYFSIVIQIIPRLNLNQHTNNKVKTIWILKSKKRINVLLWLLSSFTLFSITISSVISNLFTSQLKEGNEISLDKIKIAGKFVLFSVWFPCSIALFLFLYYGRLLVSLTKISLKLIGIEDGLLDEKKIFNANLRKMQLYNWIFSSIFLFSSISLLLLLVCSDNISSKLSFNIVYSIASVIIIPISFLVIISVTINVETLRSKSDVSGQQLSTWIQTEYESRQRYYNTSQQSHQSITRASSQLEHSIQSIKANSQPQTSSGIQSNRSNAQPSPPTHSDNNTSNADSIKI